MVPTPELPGDAARCLRRGCADVAVARCAYVDRDSAACDTAWCDNHLQDVGGRLYCARHVGIMRALDGSAFGGHRPPVRNRAASLVAWVGNDLEQRVTWALENVAVNPAKETVLSEPITLRVVPVAGVDHHLWRRSWRLAGTAADRTVHLEADEARDWEIGLSLGEEVILVTVPPWVKHHMEGSDVVPDVDRAERLAFYTNLSAQLAAALNQERTEA